MFAVVEEESAGPHGRRQARTAVPSRLSHSAAILLAVMLSACNSAPTAPANEPIAHVTPPQGLVAEAVRPREGPALAKAQRPLNDILTSLPRPSFLPTPPLNHPATRPAEPAAEAERLYMSARMAWRNAQTEEIRYYTEQSQGKATAAQHLTQAKAFVAESLNLLERADAAAPNSPAILKLLAQIYSAQNNPPKMIEAFQKTLKADPNDAEVAYILGSIEASQGRIDNAIVLLAHALSVADPKLDAPLLSLTHFNLGAMLERQGYDSAALEQYKAHLSGPSLRGRTSRFANNLLQLAQQRTIQWLVVGDALNRLGRPQDALAAYQQALAVYQDAATAKEPRVERELSLRLVYAYILLHQPDRAAAVTAEQVAKAPAQADTATALSLVMYLMDHATIDAPLTSALQGLYSRTDRPSQLAIVIANQLPPNEARAFALNHLKARPEDYKVFESLIRREFSGAKDTSPTDALRDFDRVINAYPNGAQRYAALVIRADTTGELLPPALASPPADIANKPSLGYLKVALMRSTEGRTQEQLDILQQIAQANPDFLPARLLAARLSIQAGRFDQAHDLLAPVDSSLDPQTAITRAELAFAERKAKESLEILDAALAKAPNNPELTVAKVGLFIQSVSATGDSRAFTAAEKLLTDALSAYPRSELLYESLFALYDQKILPDSESKKRALLNKAAADIPYEWVTRLAQARDAFDSNDFNRSAALFEAMLKDNPSDFTALSSYLWSLYKSGRIEQADLIVKQRQSYPKAPRSVARAVTDYELSVADDMLNHNRGPEALARLQAALARPVGDEDALLRELAIVARKINQPVKADAAYKDAIRRHPDKEADLLYDWSLLYQNSGNYPRAEELLTAALKKDPKHVAANNSLGYLWADRGEHLDEAQRMIKLALDGSPNNPMILDSMGWVLYKSGRFEDAAVYLSRAAQTPGGADPVIIDHLADTLYRLGQTEQAEKLWKTILTHPKLKDDNNDPEYQALRNRLKAKLEAADKGAPPPVADAPATQPATPRENY